MSKYIQNPTITASPFVPGLMQLVSLLLTLCPLHSILCPTDRAILMKKQVRACHSSAPLAFHLNQSKCQSSSKSPQSPAKRHSSHISELVSYSYFFPILIPL